MEEKEILAVKNILAYLLRNEPWSGAELLNLKQSIKNLGLRVDNKQDDDNLLRERN